MPSSFDVHRGSGPYLFVSYSSEDSDLVLPEMKRLDRLGFHLWFDGGIEPASKWTDRIYQALDGSAAVLLFLTPRSAGNRWVGKELTMAVQTMGKPVIAVHLAETKTADGLALLLADTQAILKYRLDDAAYLDKLGVVYRSVGGVLPEGPPEPDVELAETYRLRGEEALERREYDRAIRLFDEAIRLAPRRAASHVGRGRARLGRKEIGPAVLDLDEAIRLDPSEASAYFHRGRGRCLAGHYEEGLADFRKAQEIDPTLVIPKALSLRRLRRLKWLGKAAAFCKGVVSWPASLWPGR